jgi:hypothetical protein
MERFRLFLPGQTRYHALHIPDAPQVGSLSGQSLRFSKDKTEVPALLDFLQLKIGRKY